MKAIHKRKTKIVSRGFVFLFAALVASIALAVGLGILSITEKELVLSSIGKASVHAFFSADTGGECALMWDLRHPGLSNTAFATSSSSAPPGVPVTCAGTNINTLWTIVSDPTSATTTFSLTFPGSKCATVVVSKTNKAIDTVVRSQGYNSCSVTDPRRVERILRISY